MDANNAAASSMRQLIFPPSNCDPVSIGPSVSPAPSQLAAPFPNPYLPYAASSF